MIFNILLILLMALPGVFYSTSWVRILAGGLLACFALLNLIYCLKFRPEKNRFAIYVLCGAVILLLADIVITINFVIGIILLTLSYAAFLCALFTVFKFEINDLIYGGAIAIPTVLLAIFSQIFGFANIWVELLIIFGLTVVSMLVGKAFYNLIKNQNATNILLVVACVGLYLAYFISLVIGLSYVSHFINIVYYALLYISSGIVCCAVFTNAHADRNEYLGIHSNSYISTKHCFRNSVIMLVIAGLVGFSVVSCFQNWNIANPKITKAQFLSIVGDDLNIPIVEINTKNNQHPANKKDYINASFAISNCSNPEYNFAVEMADDYGDDGSVGIRLRGNSTKLARKKPYRVKFNEKRSLMGLKKNKSWVLLADYYDQSYIRNYAAFVIASKFDNLDFTPTPNHVALILNGNFMGLYLLCEQVDENSGRANVKEDFDINSDTEFPFLIEMDEKAWKEGITGVDNFFVEQFPPVEIKYPEADERGATEENDPVFDYIYEYVNAAFAALRTNSKVNVSFRDEPVAFEDLVDMCSAADYYLVNEIMHNTDSKIKSIYMHKTKNGKLKFGPVWDFDYSMATEWEVPYRKSYIENSKQLCIANYSPIFTKLLTNKTFEKMVVERFNLLNNQIHVVYSNLFNYKVNIDNVAVIDARMWHGKTGEFQYDMQYDYVRLFLNERLAYLETIFAQ